MDNGSSRGPFPGCQSHRFAPLHLETPPAGLGLDPLPISPLPRLLGSLEVE
jgi:hypothetical protein